MQEIKARMQVILNHMLNNRNQVRYLPKIYQNPPLEEDDSFLEQEEDPPQRRKPNLRNFGRRDNHHRNIDDFNDPFMRVKVEALMYVETYNPNKFLDLLV